MDVVFIGNFYPAHMEEEIRKCSKSGLDHAANNFQWALIKGLDYFYPHLRLISLPNIGTFPFNYKNILFSGSKFNHSPNSDDYCLSFINIPFANLLSKNRSLFKWLKKNINKENKTTLIVYGLHTPFLKAAIDYKQKHKNTNVCLIVPDLPEFMSGNRNVIYLLLKRLDRYFINDLLENVDSFVLLNNLMTNALNVNNRPWVLVEGIYDSTEISDKICEKEKNITILYTGKIDERYGLRILIDSFMLIKKENYRLWIRGNGDTFEYLKEACKLDPRIIYFGQMSKIDLVNLQKKATVLINPISSKQEFTKYFFPSKTMDYLASGTPTIMTRIEGVPLEYYDYVYVIEKEDEEGYRAKIIEVCEKNDLELKNFGERAAKFIIDKKNHIIQGTKIYKMINI